MRVHFKNGKSMKLSQEIVNLIHQDLKEQPQGPEILFECFENQSGDTLLIINLQEVTHITK